MPVQELDVVGQPQNNQNSNNGGGFLGGLLGLFGQLGDILEDVIGGSNRGDSKRRPLRELYPRQPWHDIHVKVTGVAGRDISSYFVQVISKILFLFLLLFLKKIYFIIEMEL